MEEGKNSIHIVKNKKSFNYTYNVIKKRYVAGEIKKYRTCVCGKKG
jgi:hypothetical protein